MPEKQDYINVKMKLILLLNGVKNHFYKIKIKNTKEIDIKQLNK
jgi:hypothetical protein